MAFPKVVRVRQRFHSTRVEDIPDRVAREVGRLDLSGRLKPGDSVAITAGSRGVANIAAITRSLAEELKKRGARPFIVPAMGSHGGGTAEGQRGVLERYGITEVSMGVPVRATMETLPIGESPEGVPVVLDRNALEADHIAVVNRIKPHTDFDAEIESGLTKMLAIGLGKHQGAIRYHRANKRYGYYRVLTGVAEVVRRRCSILLGLGIVENGYDQTGAIEAMTSAELFEVEKRLLRVAKSWLARIPIDRGDLLLVDEMGKNVSGTGMDTNVIGRRASSGKPFAGAPRFSRIVVRDLTPESYGNAIGVGMADVVTRRLVDKIDTRPTYVNALTSTNLESVRIPVTVDSDREALETAISTSGAPSGEDCRMVWIRNTLKLDRFVASEALLDEVEANRDLQVLGCPGELGFDAQGNLKDLF
ncbi:MAG: lactate racemase domain-containing protein [Acidobacteriota bacterium]|nr:lactate racemase domain-containing protein [Acidobacteriota bacterium]